MTTANLATRSTITDDQADAAVAAWFGITKPVPVEKDVRDRMRLAIAAAVGNEPAAPIYVVRNSDGRLVDAYDTSPDLSTYHASCSLQVIGTQSVLATAEFAPLSIREELARLLHRADQEGQVVTVELVSVPPLAMGRVVMLGSTRAAGASTLAFRAEEAVESEAGLEYSSEERDQEREWAGLPR